MNNESDALCGSVMIFKKLGPMHEIKHKSRSRRISVSHSNKRSFSIKQNNQITNLKPECNSLK